MTAPPRLGFRVHFVLLAVLWAWAIHQMSSQPSRGVPPPFLQRLVWNGGHAAVYGLLSGLLLSGLPERPRWWTSGLLACAAYGAFDEWHQSHVAGRVASVTDWITDVCGVALGLTVILLLRGPTRSSVLRTLGAGVACFAAALLATL